MLRQRDVQNKTILVYSDILKLLTWRLFINKTF